MPDVLIDRYVFGDREQIALRMRPCLKAVEDSIPFDVPLDDLTPDERHFADQDAELNAELNAEPNILTITRWLAEHRGFSILPLDHPDDTWMTSPSDIGKTAAVKWKELQQHAATAAQLIEWFGKGRRRNYAIITGVISRLVVVDGDSTKGLAWMQVHLPTTPMRTQTHKGEHWYFQHPGEFIKNDVRIQTGDPAIKIDVRGDGGYVVGPGSLHYTRIRYTRLGEWPPVDNLPIFDPAWLEPDTPEGAAPKTPKIVPLTIPHGQRHDTLFKEGCRLRQRGYEAVEIADTLWTLHTHRSEGPEVPRSNIDAIAKDICQRYVAGTSLTTSTPSSSRIEIVEDLQTFLQRMENLPPLSWHCEGLIPDEGMALWHGQPRDFKSMCAQEVALALASGRSAFGLARFAVSRALRVCYFTEEDPERLFAARMHWLTRRNPMPDPQFFFPFIRRSLSFDVEEDRDFILSKLFETHSDVGIFDPMRSFTGLSDKGPSDLRPVALFLRQIQNETLAKSLLLVHHDVKPPAAATESDRSRSQQASGGGIFSICDCPVSFTKLEWNQVACYPEDYKLCGNPKPFTVTFTSDERESDNGPTFGSWVLPVAQTTEEKAIADAAIAKRVLKFLREHLDTWFSNEEIKERVQVRGGTAPPVLEKLYEDGLVLFATGDDAKALDRSPKAKLWRGLPEPVASDKEPEFWGGHPPRESDRRGGHWHSPSPP